MTLDEILQKCGISLRPDFTQDKQRDGSEFMFAKRFTIGDKTVEWVHFGDFAKDINETWSGAEDLNPMEICALAEQIAATKEAFTREKLLNQERVADEAVDFIQRECTDRGDHRVFRAKESVLGTRCFYLPASSRF